jgi:NAD-dependent dihydropyrimidine dehydrogenase PreA subunit
VGYVPSQTITELKGDKLNRYEWLRLLADNCVCGIDANGKYTTDSANIVSEQTACDVWTVGNEIYIGVNGCTRSNKSSHVWNKKTCDITNAIIDIPEIEINVHPVQKVIVIGKNNVTGEASVGTNPTIVITDDSCVDVAACEKRAKDELSKQNKFASLTLNVNPDLFYSKVIELGCYVTISEPAFVAGTYEIIEMEITIDKCSITLDRPKKRLETILDDLKRRMNLIERWR